MSIREKGSLISNVLWGCAKLIMAGLIGLPVAQSSAGDIVPVPTLIGPSIDWSNIGHIAGDFVLRETPASAFPFARPSVAAMAASTRKVFIYYFPFFLISMDNQPITSDHWAIHYMRRSGEGGKYTSAGGFVRERPLPAGPWNSPFWREVDEAIDVLRAQATGADGFGVGIQQAGSGATFEISRGICDAASHVAPAFRIFPEPDGGVLRNVPAQLMAKTIAAYNDCSASLRLPNGHMLLAPFAPQNEPVEYWGSVLDELRGVGVIADFIPVLLDPGRFAEAFGPISAGMSFWGFRDPQLMTSVAGRQMIGKVRLAAPLWMQPVTPQDFRPKDTMFWEARNTETFRTAWMAAIEGRAQYVHLITWNDYSEGTEIAPSSGTQFLFYDLTAYYTAWFKTGQPPPILRDAIYYSHRNQIFRPDYPPVPGDTPFRRFGATPVSNDIEMIAMLVRPATLEIDIGGHVYQQQALAGLTSFRVPAAVGRPRFRIFRDGEARVEKLSDWTIVENPDSASPLYFGGSSTRAFVKVPTSATQIR
jgi:hypothetical protein